MSKARYRVRVQFTQRGCRPSTADISIMATDEAKAKRMAVGVVTEWEGIIDATAILIRKETVDA